MNLLKHDNVHTDLLGKRRIRNVEDGYAKLWKMYVALESERDRIQQALDHAMKGDMDPEDRVIIAQILAGVGEEADDE